MLNEASLFKVPVALSQTTSLTKGCSSSYVTNVIYTSSGPKNEYCKGTFSCNPYGSSRIDASSDASTNTNTIVGIVNTIVGIISMT